MENGPRAYPDAVIKRDMRVQQAVAPDSAIRPYAAACTDTHSRFQVHSGLDDGQRAYADVLVQHGIRSDHRARMDATRQP